MGPILSQVGHTGYRQPAITLVSDVGAIDAVEASRALVAVDRYTHIQGPGLRETGATPDVRASTLPAGGRLLPDRCPGKLRHL